MGIEEGVWVGIEGVLVPEGVGDWVGDCGSVTRKLRGRFGVVAVNVLSHEVGRGDEGEMRLVGADGDCVVREVELMGDGVVVVVARSIIPIVGGTEELVGVGNGALGDVLFRLGGVREGIEVMNKEGVWGRRSVFVVGEARVLVSEFFLEGLYAR